MMNSNNSRYKLSTIEKDTNRQVYIIFQIQTVLCIVAATYATIWNFNYSYPYLHPADETAQWESNRFLFWIKTAFTWLLLFTNFIPISLLLTLEIVKFF